MNDLMRLNHYCVAAADGWWSTQCNRQLGAHVVGPLALEEVRS